MYILLILREIIKSISKIYNPMGLFPVIFVNTKSKSSLAIVPRKEVNVKACRGDSSHLCFMWDITAMNRLNFDLLWFIPCRFWTKMVNPIVTFWKQRKPGVFCFKSMKREHGWETCQYLQSGLNSKIFCHCYQRSHGYSRLHLNSEVAVQ